MGNPKAQPLSDEEFWSTDGDAKPVSQAADPIHSKAVTSRVVGNDTQHDDAVSAVPSDSVDKKPKRNRIKARELPRFDHDGVDYVKSSFDMPADMHRRLKVLTASKGITMVDVMLVSVKEWIDRNSE